MKTYTVKVGFSLYKYGEELPHPRDIPDPEGAKKVKWLSNTIVENIAIVYEFKDKNSMDLFINSPPDVFKDARIMILDFK